jgi:hypothetical protein
MNENIVLLGASILLFLLIVISFRFHKTFAICNLALFVMYTSYLAHGLFYDSKDGKALGWFLYLSILTAIHLVFVLVYLLKKLFFK